MGGRLAANEHPLEGEHEMITSKFFSSKTLTAAVTALALSSQAIGFASSASAYERHGDGYGYDRRFDGPRDRRDFGPRDFNRRDFERRDNGRRDFDRRPQHVERRKKDNTGRNIAIGLGAFMLGAIIASEAARR